MYYYTFSTTTYFVDYCERLPGLYGIGAVSLVGCDAPTLMSSLGSSGLGPSVKFLVCFPLIYHYFGAVRHTVSVIVFSFIVYPVQVTVGG